jgi:hypothetical protein
LAAAGVPGHTIQLLGRWRSNAYTQYIQVPDEVLFRASAGMIRETQEGPGSR